MQKVCLLPLMVLLYFAGWRPVVEHRAGPAPAVLPDSSLVNRFYRLRGQSLFWFAPGVVPAACRQQLMACIDSAAWRGLDSNRYHPQRLRQLDAAAAGENDRLMESDRLFTGAWFAFCKDLYRGAGIDEMISYDGVSSAYAGGDDRFLSDRLSSVASAQGLRSTIDGLEPTGEEYLLLRDSLRALPDTAALSPGNSVHSPMPGITFRRAQLERALNTYRWIHHHRFPRCIVVNIAAADLRYYTTDSMRLYMKVVAGQASKRTPRFAAWCNQLILYPYWNIPRKISVKELLPLFKRSPALAALMNIQVLDSRGRKIDPAGIDWASYTAGNFPYALRQAPGCDNALGVLKFNINSPYDVYLHDTNLHTAFSSSYRYLSHGCIRLERPFALGSQLLYDRLDTTLLRSCLKDQQPYPIDLDKPVPVFVIYNTVGMDTTGRLAWYKDVYHLLKHTL